MNPTDYSRIASVYDKNPIRHNQPKEILIEQILKEQSHAIHILDLACGTGNYLLAQKRAYERDDIEWFGCDLSEKMLAIAKEKLLFPKLRIADASRLPYESDFFDLVACNFAFHHFSNKMKCIKEIHRVLKPKGIFLMNNICPEYMPLSWVYHYFPKTKAIDRKRFWNNARIFSGFESAGFDVEMKTTITLKNYGFNRLLLEAENRDMSQLTLISDDEYERGKQNLLEDSKANPTYHGDFAVIRCVARKDNEC
jgi:ubiquinone/menaquinone biosynthesis C-methylase UbiE